MLPATAWDDPGARAWSVMGRLEDRQKFRIREAREARRRINARANEFGPIYRWMTVASAQQEYRDAISARWRGGPSVLAFLFAQPDSDAMRMLDARGEYFDIRSGDTWDLFFPGYYRSPKSREFEINAGGRRVGQNFAENWYFSARDFDGLRRHVEYASERRWVYSGGTDLILINGWMPDRGEPTIDWASTISGRVTDQADGTRTLTLANIIERISDDLETDTEDAAYGVADVTKPNKPKESHVTRDIMVNAVGGIAAAIGAKVLGL